MRLAACVGICVMACCTRTQEVLNGVAILNKTGPNRDKWQVILLLESVMWRHPCCSSGCCSSFTFSRRAASLLTAAFSASPRLGHDFLLTIAAGEA